MVNRYSKSGPTPAVSATFQLLFAQPRHSQFILYHHLPISDTNNPTLYVYIGVLIYSI